MKIIGQPLEERLRDDVTEGREGHEFRYRLARGFLGRGDVVFDMACGTGYGRRFLQPGVVYRGIDMHAPVGPEFRTRDLRTWTAEGQYYDVAVSFETIEHLSDYSVLVRTLLRARKWVIASVPIVPTVGNNPYHHHDFLPGQLAGVLLADAPGWRLYEKVLQPSEEAEIVVLERVGA